MPIVNFNDALALFDFVGRKRNGGFQCDRCCATCLRKDELRDVGCVDCEHKSDYEVDQDFCRG